MLLAIKRFIRFFLYVPLRMLRFAAMLAAAGCGWWLFSSRDTMDAIAWVIAAATAFVVFVGIDLTLRWIGKPEIL